MFAARRRIKPPGVSAAGDKPLSWLERGIAAGTSERWLRAGGESKRNERKPGGKKVKAISTRLLCQPRGRTFTIAKFLWRLGASLDWHLIHRPADFSLKAVLVKRIVVPSDRPARHVNTLPKIDFPAPRPFHVNANRVQRAWSFVTAAICLADRHRGSWLGARDSRF